MSYGWINWFLDWSVMTDSISLGDLSSILGAVFFFVHVQWFLCSSTFYIQNLFKKYLQSLFHSNPLFPHFLSSFPLPPTSTVPRMHMQLTIKASPLLFHNFLVNWSVFQFKFLYRRNHISKSILSYHSCFIMKFLFFCFIASLIIASHAEESVDVVLGLVGRVIGAVFFQSHSSADPSP